MQFLVAPQKKAEDIAIDRLFSTKEVADMIKCCIKTIYNMIERGEIEYFRRGRHYVFTEQQVQEYLRKVRR